MMRHADEGKPRDALVSARYLEGIVQGINIVANQAGHTRVPVVYHGYNRAGIRVSRSAAKIR